MATTIRVDDCEVREGFICPICHRDFGNHSRLLEHFESAHSNEDKAVLQSFKEFFGKAKKKILDLDIGTSTSPSPEEKYNSIPAAENRSWQPQELGVTRSHTETFQRTRNSATDRHVIETNKLLIRLDKLMVNSHLEPSKRKAFEKSVVHWAPDKQASNCHGCGKSFSLAHRRHHCRLCGEVMCTNCSNFISITYARKLTGPCLAAEEPPKASEKMPRSRSGSSLSLNSVAGLIGEPQLRVCPTCKRLLDRRDTVLEQRYTKPIVVHLYEKLKADIDEADQLCQIYLNMCCALSSGETTYTLCDAQEVRVKLIRLGEAIDILSKKILGLGINTEMCPGLKEQQLHRAIRLRATNFLQDKMVGLPSLPTEEEVKYIKQRRLEEVQLRIAEEKSANLEFHQKQKRVLAQTQPSSSWRQSAHHYASGETGWGPETLFSDTLEDPLVQQMNNIRNYIGQARQARKYDEVRMLEKNLEELRLELQNQYADDR